MKNYLLDSDIIIWYLRGKPEIVELVQDLQKEGTLGISPLSGMEIQLGARKSEEKATNMLLDALREYVVTNEIAYLAASYIKEYKSKGITLDFVDAIIAATCRINDLILVTLNVEHYPMSEVKKYLEKEPC
jgi:predicted nucleic acid-binding protein